MDTHKTFKVFLVDDDIFYLNLLEQLVKNSGIVNIQKFQNGTDCMNNIHENPDIIFLDHNMDIMTGLDVLLKIKRFNPNIFVVMVSAQENLKTAVDSLKYGVFDYLVKGDNEKFKVVDVIERIGRAKDLLNSKKPGFFQSLFSII